MKNIKPLKPLSFFFSFFLFITSLIMASSQKKGSFTENVPSSNFSSLVEKTMNLSIQKTLAEMEDDSYSYSRLLKRNRELLKKLKTKDINILFNKLDENDKASHLLFIVALKEESEKNWQSLGKVLGLQFDENEKKELNQIAKEIEDYHKILYLSYYSHSNKYLFLDFLLKDMIKKYDVYPDFIKKIKDLKEKKIQSLSNLSENTLFKNHLPVNFTNYYEVDFLKKIKKNLEKISFYDLVFEPMPRDLSLICSLLNEKINPAQRIQTCIDFKETFKKFIINDLNYEKFNTDKPHPFKKIYDLIEKKIISINLNKDENIFNQSIDKSYALRSFKGNLSVFIEKLKPRFVENFILDFNKLFNVIVKKSNKYLNDYDINSIFIESIHSFIFNIHSKIKKTPSKEFFIDQISLPILKSSVAAFKTLSLKEFFFFNQYMPLSSLYQLFIVEFLKDLNVEEIYDLKYFNL